MEAVIVRWIVAALLAALALAIVLLWERFLRAQPEASGEASLVTHPVLCIARRPLGGGWHAFLLRVDAGPWQGWHVVRAFGLADELVAGEPGVDDEQTAREAYAALTAP